MSQKQEKPVLQGQRIKTRKRDEKEKYEPQAFRDSLVAGLKEAGNDLDSLSKFLDSAGNKLDYRRYGEVLFDVLFTGGMLAPGGHTVDDGAERAQRYVFLAETEEDVKAYYGVFFKLIRRYKYLEKAFEDELSKLIIFLKAFTPEARKRLAQVVGMCMAQGLVKHNCLAPLFNVDDHLAKEGLALDFATDMFAIWIKEKDANNVSSSLRRASLDDKLLNILPSTRRTTEHFCAHFKNEGLLSIAEMQISKASQGLKKQLGEQLSNLIEDEADANEIVAWIKAEGAQSGLTDVELVGLVWNKVMSAVEWNKKEELVADQALRHLKSYAPLLAAACFTPRAELCLLRRCQEYCYDNMQFMKVFGRIVVLFYKTDVVGEDSILRWHKDGHLSKGKSVFLDQVHQFVEWLKNAEEESDDEEEK